LEALEDWVVIRSAKGKKADSAGVHQLLEVARLVDGDPWRNRLRTALVRRDVEALRDLAKDDRVTTLPAATVARLGYDLTAMNEPALAERLLRRAQQQYPNDFWVNHDLAFTFAHLSPPNWEEAIRFYTVASALDSNKPGVYVNLGFALAQGDKL